MKTSLDGERADGAAEPAAGNKRISFSVDALLGARSEPRDLGEEADGAAAEQSGDSDDSDVDIEDVESAAGDADPPEDDGEPRPGVLVPRPLLPRLYQGPPPTWPFGAFPWMPHNPMFRTGSPNGKYKTAIRLGVNKFKK